MVRVLHLPVFRVRFPYPVSFVDVGSLLAPRGFLPTTLSVTSFPGSLLFPTPGAREEILWLGVVTCLPESERLQINNSGKGRLSVKIVSTQVKRNYSKGR